jgi:hypothetical protein
MSGKNILNQEMISMMPFDRNDLKVLMEASKNPSLSIYLPIPRFGAETRQGPLKLRALLKKAAEGLKAQNWRQPVVDKIIGPIEKSLDQVFLWGYQQQGLAIFANEDSLITRFLPIPVTEALYISNRFYTRPLLPLLTHDGQYYLLSLNLIEAKVFLGSRYSLEELAIPGMPRSLQEILTTYDVERQMRQHSGSVAGAGAGGRIIHGFENMKDIEKVRIEEYFRLIDNSLRQELAAARRPLVVASVDYLFSLYRQTSKYAPLMEEHVTGSPETIPVDDMCCMAWEIVRPVVEREKDQDWAAIQNLTGSARVIGNIRQIIAAADHGRVESLFMPAGRIIPGQYEPAAEKAARLPDTTELSSPGTVDLLDVAAISVFLKSGRVYETDIQQLPPDSDALALLRY